MPDVYVAAGSNVRPRQHLTRAIALLREQWPGLVVSQAWANKPVGFEGDDFINLAVGLRTEDGLAQVLERLHAVEAACGRRRDDPKWGPRSMDLDVLLYGDQVGEFPGAILPRPDLVRRPYMLGPLAEIAPQVMHPTLAKTIEELWEAFDSAGHEMRVVNLEDAD